LQVQLPAMCFWVSNSMGDHLWAGKPSRSTQPSMPKGR